MDKRFASKWASRRLAQIFTDFHSKNGPTVEEGGRKMTGCWYEIANSYCEMLLAEYATTDSWAAVSIPHTWNTREADNANRHGESHGKDGYHRGACWCARTLSIIELSYIRGAPS